MVGATSYAPEAVLSFQQQIVIMGVSECIQYIRENFERKYADDIAKGTYDTRDLERLRDDDIFVRTYIRGRDRLDEGVDLVHSSFKYRNEVKVNDLCEESFDQELMAMGAMFFHSKDVNGQRILWLRVKMHRKDASAERLDMEKKGVIFILNKAFNEAPLSQVIILLDMTSCGLANLDMDFVKFIITIFKSYYPSFLAYMLIYDMPWIFNAAWKVIKAWLSAEAASKIKFVTKADIQTYVKGDQLPPYMGGTDEWVYEYYKGISLEPLYPEDVEEEEKKKDKKVTFQEVEEYSSIPPTSDSVTISTSGSFSSSVDANTNARANGPLTESIRHRNHTRPNSSNNANDRQRSLAVARSQSSPQASTYVGRMLTVSPADELTFQAVENGDAFDVITLTNVLPFPVAFKVKTTSPEKFRVRPSAGIIKPDRTEEVYVYLVPDYSTDVSKDKFLIMAIEAPSGTADPNFLFRDAPKEKIMQHKLKCAATGPSPEAASPAAKSKGGAPSAKQDPLVSKGGKSSTKGKTNAGPAPTPRAPTPSYYGGERSRYMGPEEVEKQVEQLESQTRHMQRQLNVLLIIQFLTAFTLILVMLSYSCFGEDLFTHFLALPFEFCHESYGRKC